ncbi:ankyrin repeat-containing domain protein [Aspergillus cavernicola]|uniref:Ankyrin repeat-containing domain protein n=1 Tax=Aspergillus cavernicola TaxID=176166 RepID=A0ABR4IDH2_9EURO
MIAAVLGNDEVISSLMPHMYTIDFIVSSRKSPPHVAMYTGKVSTKLLMQRARILNTSDNSGMTPLALAIKYHSVDTIEYLLDHGCDVLGSVDHAGQSPLQIAVSRGNTSIVNLFLKRKASHNGIGHSEKSAAIDSSSS